jgi:translocation and assembly module TamB
LSQFPRLLGPHHHLPGGGGTLQFFGTEYTVNQGTINFYNPIKVEPILNIDLETKARGIDITLSVSGPLNKLTLTPRSDPPLQFQRDRGPARQGRTPTSDPSLMRQQTEAPQTFQQAGASALLGSAIANPVAGRLQRFFGVSEATHRPVLLRSRIQSAGQADPGAANHAHASPLPTSRT